MGESLINQKQGGQSINHKVKCDSYTNDETESINQ